MEIKINHLCFGYIKRPLSVVDFSCEIKNGEIVALVGGEGAGRTSLLRVISGLEKQYAGTMFFDGKNAETLSLEQRNISYIASDPVVFPNKSIRKNFQFLFQTINKEYDEELVCKEMEKFGLPSCLDLKMKKLSSAQRKVFTIVRANIKKPNLILIDDLFQNEKQEDCLLIKNAILLLIDEKTPNTSVILVENALNHLDNATKYFYFSFGKNKAISGLDELKNKPIDKYALEFFNHFEKDYSLFFDGYNYFLKDCEIVKKSKKQYEEVVKRQIKLDQSFSVVLALQKLDIETEMQVTVASVLDFENFSDEILNKNLKSGEIYVFDKNSFTKVL